MSIKVIGLDVFIRAAAMPAPFTEQLAGFELVSIANRGTQIWPGATPKIQLTDVHRLRFLHRGSGTPTSLALITELEKRGLEWVHIEKLHEINGAQAFS